MTVPKELLEVGEYTSAGYWPVVYFGAWRVAFLNDASEYRPERLEKIEKHLFTDEVFVNLTGEGLLIVAEGDETPGQVYCTWMETGKVYNVKKGVWHWVLTRPKTKMLIVENRDTSADNSNYARLIPEHVKGILDVWNKNKK